eukprot:jgi/Chrzof1/1737/Cz10g19050.t1
MAQIATLYAAFIVVLIGCSTVCLAARNPGDVSMLKRSDDLCSDLGRKSCLDGLKDADCAWCEGDNFYGCLDAEAAYDISPDVATCDGTKPPRGARCEDLKYKDDCLDATNKHDNYRCAWCKGDKLAACLDREAAYGIAPEIATCRGALPPLDAPCGDLKFKGDCLDATNKDKHYRCAWCKGDKLAACLDREAAYGIAPEIATCRGALPPLDAPCGDLKFKGDCLDATDKHKHYRCAWCKGDKLAACLDREAAYGIAPEIATCRGALAPLDAPCGDLKFKGDCLDATDKDKHYRCAWCKGDKLAACLDREAAYGIAPEIATCRGALPPLDAPCGDLKFKDDCLDATDKHDNYRCAWCKGDSMAACLDPEAAYGIAPSVATCKGVQPPRDVGCHDLHTKDDCLDATDSNDRGRCAWCKGKEVLSCLDAEAAYGISADIATCHGARPPRDASCSDLRNKDDCLDSGNDANRKTPSCAWCKGDNLAACLDADAASFITSDVAKCSGAAIPDVKCGDLKEKSICLRGVVDGYCAWCEGGYMPAKCLDEEAAKHIPTFVTKCKTRRHKDDDKDDDSSDKDADKVKQ